MTEDTVPADAGDQLDADPPADAGDQLDADPPADAETFPRDYVERLRQENGRYRIRAGEADALAGRLHTALVAATGRLADPTDLQFDAEHLDDAGALDAAIDALLDAKPHLAARRPAGDIGQGATRGTPTESFGLLDTLRGMA